MEAIVVAAGTGTRNPRAERRASLSDGRDTTSRDDSAMRGQSRVLVVTVTGSECTGKTTLARDLARHFGAVWVPEFARDYLDEQTGTTGLPLDASDVEPIARGQIAAEDRGRAAASGLVILDTDLVSTTVYARHYYGACPPWIDQAARDRRADLYLLCDIDVPWVADRRAIAHTTGSICTRCSSRHSTR